jgi:uncharacterized membrane protein YphA (DoxX/SURF4 family)
LIAKVLRVVLASIFLYAGGIKVFEPLLFKAVIQSFFALPDSLAVGLAVVVPWIEILAGLSLLLNYKAVYSSALIAAMSLFFFGLMAVNYGQVLPFGCACFGFHGAELVGFRHIARELLILSLAGVVFYQAWREEDLERGNGRPAIE